MARIMWALREGGRGHLDPPVTAKASSTVAPPSSPCNCNCGVGTAAAAHAATAVLRGETSPDTSERGRGLPCETHAVYTQRVGVRCVWCVCVCVCSPRER